MIRNSSKARTLKHGLALAGLVAAGLAATLTPAMAGTCPADKVATNGNGQRPGATAPKDVTDTVLASTDLAGEPVGIDDRLFRLRRLEIKPGGVVPWHSHANRPAMIYVVQGEVTEYASTCTVPIVHKAGDVAPETHLTSHWWKNLGDKTVVLFVGDVRQDKADKHM